MFNSILILVCEATPTLYCFATVDDVNEENWLAWLGGGCPRMASACCGRNSVKRAKMADPLSLLGAALSKTTFSIDIYKALTIVGYLNKEKN